MSTHTPTLDPSIAPTVCALIAVHACRFPCSNSVPNLSLVPSNALRGAHLPKISKPLALRNVRRIDSQQSMN